RSAVVSADRFQSRTRQSGDRTRATVKWHHAFRGYRRQGRLRLSRARSRRGCRERFLSTARAPQRYRSATILRTAVQRGLALKLTRGECAQERFYCIWGRVLNPADCEIACGITLPTGLSEQRPPNAAPVRRKSDPIARVVRLRRGKESDWKPVSVRRSYRP